MNKGKLVILSAPSGSGKTTIIDYVLSQNIPAGFSISATSREPRGTEQHGKEYYFLTPKEFKEQIQRGEFLEYEEVYKDRFYGTLRSEVENLLNKGNNVILDVDVAGGLNIKNIYGGDALLIFIKPPSITELKKRLEKRGTDSPQIITDRISKAEYELSLASQYDKVIINDNLEQAKRETLTVINNFLIQI
jgi:guanylate kinase